MSQLLPSARALHVVDVAVAVWVAAWIGLGVALGVNVAHLTTISATVQREGQAAETIGTSLRSLGGIPFVGGQISRDGRQVQQAGASAVSSGRRSVSPIHTISVLLAIAVALLPSVPVFGFYLPWRLNRLRETAALRRALRRRGHDPAFIEFLAGRALHSLGYHRLERISPTPSLDGDDAETAALAAAELRRLGLDPRRLRPAQRSRR